MLNQQNLPPNTKSRLETLATAPQTRGDNQKTRPSLVEIPKPTPRHHAVFEEQLEGNEQREENEAIEERDEQIEEVDGGLAEEDQEEEMYFEEKSKWREGTGEGGINGLVGVDLDEVSAIRATAQAQIERYLPTEFFSQAPPFLPQIPRKEIREEQKSCSE
jgi:hypothetical protein